MQVVFSNVQTGCRFSVEDLHKSQKVHLIVGGPNINEDLLKKGTKLICPEEPTRTNPLIIGFLGKDFIGKEVILF